MERRVCDICEDVDYTPGTEFEHEGHIELKDFDPYHHVCKKCYDKIKEFMKELLEKEKDIRKS